MAPTDSISCLSDDDLHAQVQRLTARSNVTLADLLVHLAEVEARGIHRTRACASLYTYCVYELRMSEDAAYRRSKAARLVRDYPELRDAIAKGEIHLTGVLMIGPHLGGERHAEILRRARFRSKRELLRLVAEIDPKPEMPAHVTPIGPAPAGPATHRAYMEALAGPYRELSSGQRPEDWMRDDAAATVAGQPPATTEAPRPLRYHVEFTASQEHVDLLNEVMALASHERPRPLLPDIHLRALRALARELRTKKRGGTDQPRSKSSPGRTAADAADGHGPAFTAPARVAAVCPGADTERVVRGAEPAASRYVPRASRRAVWDRDEARCAYVDERGVRCRETCGLELHHRRAYALGGPPSTVNLELRCVAHNTLAAERDFGRERMDWIRGVHDTWCAFVPGRTIWMSSLTLGDPDAPTRTAAETLPARDEPAAGVQLAPFPDGYAGRAAVATDDEGNTQLSLEVAQPHRLALLTFVVDDAADLDWALAVAATVR